MHLIGHAGTGKSSLLPEIVRALEEAESASAVDGVAGAGNPAVNLAVAPVDAFLACLLASRLRPGIRQQYRSARTWFHVLQKERRRWRNAAGRWIVVDEGMTNRIRKCCRPLPGSLLRALPLPDAVVSVEAPKEQRYRRVLERHQAIPERKLITSQDRIRKVKNRAIGLRACMSFGEVDALLRKWNDRACNPPLTEAEVNAVIEAARNEPPKAGSRESYWAWMKPAFERAGVLWIDVTNDDEADPQELAQMIARQIMAQQTE